MHKYLIFRTDRIGDFIFSRTITQAIKKKNPNNIIDFVCSSYNSEYAKNYKDIKNIYIFDKYNLSLMIKNLIKINSNNYDYLIILDSKRRSFFFSIFLKVKYKIILLKDWRPLFLIKLFFNNYLINSEINTQYENFTTLANILHLQLHPKIDYYKSYSLKLTNKINQKNYLLLHLDEKWFEGFYFSDYKKIKLNKKNFNLLIKTLLKKFKKSIIITTGKSEIPLLNQIINSNFIRINDNEYESIKFKKKLKFFKGNSFQNLELFVKNCSILLCCEGAISHVSNSFEKKTFALVDNFSTGKFWTNHMKKIKLLKRDNIYNLCNAINKI